MQPLMDILLIWVDLPAGQDVTLWGDGSARREFLHVDDLAEACFICMRDYDSAEPINVGTGKILLSKNLQIFISEL